MSLQEVFEQERSTEASPAVHQVRYFYTVSGLTGAQIVNAASDYSVAINRNNELIEMVDLMMAATDLLKNMNTVTWGVQQTAVAEVTVSNVDDGQYDPAFVARVLKADAEPMRTFDNVVDLMEWLDRD